MTNKATTPVSPRDEEYHKALIKATSQNAQKLLIYSRVEGLSPQQTLFSMVLCVAILANTLGLTHTLHAGIDAALSDLQEGEEE